MPTPRKPKPKAPAQPKRDVPPRSNRRTPKSREAAIAQRANDYARPSGTPSFGAPVSATQVELYERALKTLRKTRPLAEFLGFKSRASAVTELGRVARGAKSSRTLSPKTRESFEKLSSKLDSIYRAEQRVNKTWPRKHAIVLHALLTEKPTRKRAASKPKPSPAPAPAADSTPSS